ncbi:hypothetical protein TERTU_0539 [Teredinibacter turnerae T7901]|uniref:Nucleoside 2-deoxyribosyltransferase n=1 Tax=Teredinibacter turnerae (strain ATCC 39867 / T7901) TaxID=377629 RepID=C5BN40_TERTT|nr:hypothetical protein [Teredinibacter turnerae]ACR12941.1 hypothetical protein TERTU_0539 [Teredinibacter turnerae T7901]
MFDTRPKPFVFVLMPFSEEFRDIYELGIKSACELAGAYCERVDEQIFEERMLDRIYNQIAKADVIISDMTGKNPNVFYETGYAHALGKRVLLLTRQANDIPFDLKHFQHVIYQGKITYLKNELVRRIEWAINHPKENSEIFSTSIRYMVQGVEVIDGAQSYIVEHFDKESRSLERTLQLDLFNLSDGTINSDQVRLSLDIDCYSGASASLMPDGKYLHRLPIKEDIYPGSHISIRLDLHVPQGIDHDALISEGVKATLHESTKFGKMSRNLILKLVTQERLEVITHNKELQRTSR